MTGSDPEHPSQNSEAASQSYQVMLLTPRGQVVRTQSLAACNDDQASRFARSIVDRHAVDLWNGLRFIEHFTTEKPIATEQP